MLTIVEVSATTNAAASSFCGGPGIDTVAAEPNENVPAETLASTDLGLFEFIGDDYRMDSFWSPTSNRAWPGHSSLDVPMQFDTLSVPKFDEFGVGGFQQEPVMEATQLPFPSSTSIEDWPFLIGMNLPMQFEASSVPKLDEFGIGEFEQEPVMEEIELPLSRPTSTDDWPFGLDMDVPMQFDMLTVQKLGEFKVGGFQQEPVMETTERWSWSPTPTEDWSVLLDLDIPMQFDDDACAIADDADVNDDACAIDDDADVNDDACAIADDADVNDDACAIDDDADVNDDGRIMRRTWHQFRCGCEPASTPILFSSTDVITIHRCSQKHRRWRLTHTDGELETVQLFFSAATCRCGKTVLRRPVHRVVHLQSRQHLFRMHDAVRGQYGDRYDPNRACVVCSRLQAPAPPKSLVWTFEQIRHSYENVVSCVVSNLLKFELNRFGRAPTSLVELMMPDPDNLIYFDPAYMLDSRGRVRDVRLGVTDEQIFQGSCSSY